MAKNKVHVARAQVGLRFLGGMPLSGQNLTNRGPIRRGTMVLDDRFKPNMDGWYEPTDRGHRVSDVLHHYLPQLRPETGHGFRTGPAWRSYLEMMALRWSLMAGSVCLPAEILTGVLPVPLASGVGLTTLTAVGARQYFVVTDGPKRQVRQAVVSQLHDALDGRRPRVRMDLDGRRVDELRVALPSDLVMTDVRRKAIASAIRQVLPTHTELDWPDYLTDWTLITTAPDEVPTLVSYDQVADVMRRQREGIVVLGVTASGSVLTADLDNDDPHVAVSMATGRGKSVLLRALIAQFLEQGAFVNVADVKRISLHEYRNTPGVRIYRDVETIWDVISNFKTEMMERYAALEAVDVSEWPRILAGFRRKILMFEEMNAFAQLSQTYYDQIKQPGDRAQIPAFAELGEVLSMSRAVKMNVVVVGQRLSGKVLGGGDQRENFGTRILSNPTTQTWRMLAEGKKPANSAVKGRNVGIIAGVQTIYQGVYMTAEEAKAHALTPRYDWSDVLGQSDAMYQVDAGVGRRTEEHGLTLRDIADRTGLKVETVRKRAQREGWESTGQRQGASLYPVSILSELGTASYDPSEVVEDVD